VNAEIGVAVATVAFTGSRLSLHYGKPILKRLRRQQ
jgi:hypothetical protein